MSFPGFIILIYYVHSFEVFELEVHFMRPVLVAKNSWSLRKLTHWEGGIFCLFFILGLFIDEMIMLISLQRNIQDCRELGKESGGIP